MENCKRLSSVSIVEIFMHNKNKNCEKRNFKKCVDFFLNRLDNRPLSHKKFVNVIDKIGFINFTFNSIYIFSVMRF